MKYIPDEKTISLVKYLKFAKQYGQALAITDNLKLLEYSARKDVSFYVEVILEYNQHVTTELLGVILCRFACRNQHIYWLCMNRKYGGGVL
jgi:hypothetical protein